MRLIPPPKKIYFMRTAKGFVPLLAGFECSTHRTSDGRRLDLVAQTCHDRYAQHDFARVKQCGMRTVREGLRWHVIESERGQYDWSSVDTIILAAQSEGIEIIWDLLHFGFPDWVNPYHPDFPSIFGDFAEAFSKKVAPAALYVPINEISFLSWAAGDVEYMYPWSKGRGGDLKRALCAAALMATRAIRSVDYNALIIAVEPMIAVKPFIAPDQVNAQHLHDAQFEAIDMLLGNAHADLGGAPDMVDVIGVNHYPHSQWYSDAQRSNIAWKSADWTALSILLRRVYERYRKPLLLAETGAEGDMRAHWLNYITAECQKAQLANIPIMGICLYPILSHIAWTGERFCPNGLFDGSQVSRDADPALLNAVLKYQHITKDISLPIDQNGRPAEQQGTIFVNA